MSLSIENLAFSYGATRVLDQISVTFADGELVAVVGPNGAGKSTLLTLCAALRAPSHGVCRYQGKPLAEWNRAALARNIAFVPQTLQVEFPFTAEQVVLMGRAPYGDGLFESQADFDAATEAMRLTDSLEFRHRDFRALSGGERQRIVLASALAQQPKVLLLDEPTTFLDLKHQFAIYQLLAQLARQGMLIITATHDLNLAASYSTRTLVLHHGRAHSFGATRDTLTESTIREVFEVPCRIIPQDGGGYWIAYG